MDPNQPAPLLGTGNNDGDVDPYGQLVSLNYNGFPLMLPLPKLQDDLETAARKVKQLANAVGNGLKLSLINITADEIDETEARAIEAIGIARMTSRESVFYDSWKNNRLTLPRIDWVANRFPIREPISEKLWKYAKAMDIIWDHEGAVPGNYTWLCGRQARYLPLVKAVMKVMAATASFGDPAMAQLGGPELMEYQTLKTIVASAEGSLKRERERIDKLSQQIAESKSILQERLKKLETLEIPQDIVMMDTE